MSNVLTMVEACLDACGSDRFGQVFSELAEQSGARQVMIFDLSGSQACCLLSRNFSRERLGEVLAEAYLEGGFREDPLLPVLTALSPGQRKLVRVRVRDSDMSESYRQRFFSTPGLSGKLAVLAVGEERRIIVNFYLAAQGEGGGPEAALASLAAKIALMHFEGLSRTGPPPALDVLSARERQVCLGMLDGKKAELIALELSVSPETIATYRKRAYAKLGISSKGALFALCRQGAAVRGSCERHEQTL